MTNEEKKQGDELVTSDVFKNIKAKHVVILLLFAFLALGFYLRVYHIDFPSIGYHNMKENEYLCQAMNQPRYGDYLRRIQCLGGMDAGPSYFEEYPQMPLIPWIILLSWKVLGHHFWSARIGFTLLSTASIYLIYLVAKRLTKNEYISLVSAFLSAIMPLLVFFGRNIQPEGPALFFLLLGTYYYLKWLDDYKTKSIVFSGIAFAICGLLKYTFLIVFIPVLAIFPFVKLKDKTFLKKTAKQVGIFLVCLLPVPLWTYFSKFLNTTTTLTAGTLYRVNLFRAFEIDYWNQFYPTFRAYVFDNFTFWYFWIAIFGIVLMFLLIKDKNTKYYFWIGVLIAALWAISAKFTTSPVMFFILMAVFFILVLYMAVLSLKQENKFVTFVLWYFVAIAPYFMILSDYLNQHNYYQMPFVPIVCIASAYFIYTVGTFLDQIFKRKQLKFVPLLLILLTIGGNGGFIARANAQFDTIFYGEDVSGDYIKQHSMPEARMFIEGHAQTVGICFNSDRRCAGIPESLTNFTFAEEKRNFSIIFLHGIYGAMQFNQKDTSIKQYVENNYQIRQITLFQSQQGAQIQGIVLMKGGNSTLSLDKLGENPILRQPTKSWAKTYSTKHGDVAMTVLEYS